MAKLSKHELREAILADESLSEDVKGQLLDLLKTPTFGLVWEEKTEDVIENLRENLPVLKEDKSKAIISDDPEAPNHVLIEGDNLDALYSLAYTHEGKIDVIYIDPPYNTGAKNWKYNNDYVEKEDSYRHSKFISFIERRMKMAKKLLSHSGIIICAIDDYEEHNVRHIMDMVFGEDNRLGTVTVVHNPRGRNDDTFIATMHEYLLFYAKDAAIAEIGCFPLSEADKKAYNKNDGISDYNETSFIRTGNNSLRIERPGLWYEIFYNESSKKLSLTRESDNDILLLPINGKGEERCWRWGPETFQQLKDTELFVKSVGGEYKIYKKRRITNIEGRKPRTVWVDSKYDASSNGIMLLQKIFDGVCPFPFPKSLYAVKDALLITAPKDAIIVDFFAGSGTTLHATMELNAEDGGHRQCILVTNNESNICEEVTYERNKRVINGYTTPKGERVEGLHANNLRYYRVEHTPRKHTHENKMLLAQAMTEMLQIKWNAYKEPDRFGNLRVKPKYMRYFEGDENVLIVYVPEIIPYLVKEIKALVPEKKLHIYIAADGNYAFSEEFAEVAQYIELAAIPSTYYNAIRSILPAPLEETEEYTPEAEDEEILKMADKNDFQD